MPCASQLLILHLLCCFRISPFALLCLYHAAADLGSPTDHRLSKRPRAGDTADPVPVDALKLQQLLGSQLGPPQFAVPKPSGHAATASLEALLEQEMGPPKFATLKEPSIIPQTVPNLALAPEPALPEHSAFPEPTAHLRLEVLNGPEAGKVFDTLDSASEVSGIVSGMSLSGAG